MTSTGTRAQATVARRRRSSAEKLARRSKDLPCQVTLHGIGPDPIIEQDLRRKLAWLRRYSLRITGCRVTVDAPHRRRRKGRLYRVRVTLHVPRGELAVARNCSRHHAHEDLQVAIHDAFDAARRELMDYARLKRGQVKRRARMQSGRVARLETDHGFIEAEDGREIYFHRNSVLGGLEAPRVGTEVRFAEEIGDKGPQASTVAIVHPRSRRAAASGSRGER
jgi:cold shock CspA family protein